jgi:ketosteroid isomerase-like protein
MTKLLAFSALALAGFGLAACTQKPAAAPPADTAAIAAALKLLEAQWNQEYAAHQTDKALAHYSADASLMPSGMAPMRGTRAIGAGLTALVGDPNFHLDFTSDKVKVAQSGDIAYTRGTYTLHVSDPTTHKPLTDTGTYLTVYEKQADGSWKAVDDMTASGAPAK